jgi:transposase
MILADFPSVNQDDKPTSLLDEQVALVLEQALRIDELTQLVDRKSDVISAQKNRIHALEELLRLSKIKRFAPSSEQSQQAYLFDEAEVEAEIALETAAASAEEEALAEALEPAASEPPKVRQKPGRKPFSSALPREQIFITLSDAEKAGAIDTFFTKVREELDIIPAQVRILEYMQEKAVFMEPVQGEQQRRITAALMPKHPVPGAMGSINLMCFVLIAKYGDGLPLYRQESILARYGGELSRATLAK